MTAGPQTFADVLLGNAQAHGDRPAVIAPAGTLTHAGLARRARCLAGGLAALGVRGGDRIAVLAGNRTELLELLGAAACLGAALVMLNVRWSEAEIARVVEDVQPRLLFAEPELEALLSGVPPSFACRSFGAGQGRLAAWDGMDVSQAFAGEAAQADWPLLGIPTAAVEGRPRVAMLSHAALLAQARLLGQVWSLDARDRYLCVLPLFHTAAMILSLAALVPGGAVVMQPGFDPEASAQAIAAHGATFFASFSPMLAGILDAAQAAGLDLGGLRAVTGLESAAAIERLGAACPGAVFWAMYGQTETAGFATLAPARERPGAAGKPLPGVQLAIQREDGAWAAQGEPGEIVVQGPCLFSGYWRLPDETAHARRGGWHHTGDLGRLDEDGHLWYLGRTEDKALIKSGGENIYPAEVEGALRAHPAVKDAAVIGVADERWGEAVRAVCVLKDGQAADPQELIEFVAGRIARFKRPRDVLFTEALPRLADGRADRAAVRARYAKD